MFNRIGGYMVMLQSVVLMPWHHDGLTLSYPDYRG